MPDPEKNFHNIARAEASAWLARRDRGLSPSETSALEAWLAEDPRHRAEFEKIERTWSRIDPLVFQPGMDELADRVQAGVARRRAQKNAWLAAGGIAAAALIVIAAIRVVSVPPASAAPPAVDNTAARHYKIIPSAARRVTLPDGSYVDLNGNSRIEVDFSGGSRDVRLLQGEAYFVVAKNPDRPFRVIIPEALIQAVGTEFDVNVSNESPAILVSEGSVQLFGGALAAPSAPIAAGQLATISRNPHGASVEIGAVTAASIDSKLAWRTTRFDFDETPLNEVIDAFNGYNARKLALADPVLRQRPITGVFRVDNLDTFLRLAPASVNAKPVLVSEILVRLEPLPER